MQKREGEESESREYKDAIDLQNTNIVSNTNLPPDIALSATYKSVDDQNTSFKKENEKTTADVPDKNSVF
jgi:hypothetical protein